MRSKLRVLYIPIFALLVSCGGVVAQPPINVAHSNEAIAEMIATHKMSKSIDVFPEPALLNRFKDDFPNAVDLDWERTTDLFEVEFDLGGTFNRVDYTAYYDNEYNLVGYKHEIGRKELPQAVKQSIERDYEGFKIEDTDKIVIGTDVHYKVEIEKGRVEYKLAIKEDGTIIPTPLR